MEIINRSFFQVSDINKKSRVSSNRSLTLYSDFVDKVNPKNPHSQFLPWVCTEILYSHIRFSCVLIPQVVLDP